MDLGKTDDKFKLGLFYYDLYLNLKLNNINEDNYFIRFNQQSTKNLALELLKISQNNNINQVDNIIKYIKDINAQYYPNKINDIYNS